MNTKIRTVILDIEGNDLENPTRIWTVCCRDCSDGEKVWVFNHPDLNPQPLIEFLRTVNIIVGHNILGYDVPVINKLCSGVFIDPDKCIDTLVVSRAVFTSIEGGHSLKAWGERLGEPKTDFNEWDKWSQLLVDYCIQDTKVNYVIYKHLYKYIYSSKWREALKTEHYISSLCNELHTNGFCFNKEEAIKLKETIDNEINLLNKELLSVFPKRTKLHREVHPKLTKFNTLNKGQFKFYLKDNPDGDLSVFNGGPFSVIEWYEFNPGSAKQRIERLWEAGWQPTERTTGHKDFLKSIRRQRRLTPEEEAKKAHYQVYGWTTSGENLKTLPDTAPEAARKLVRWLLVARRSQILQTWLDACTAFSVSPEGTVWKIHGRFVHIGAWTHRMAHSEPNTGNIPKFDASQPEKTPYSDKMRGLWIASPDRYLVGVDAEGIQLRVLAHYINDPEFTEALIRGDKKLGTDAHSMNQKALGDACKSRDDAKTFIYAWILDAGIGRVAEILGCTRPEAEEASEKFLKRYPGLKILKEEIVPSDAERGFFIGLDGRPVRIWGDTLSERQHFALAGYLQNGESVIMKRATQIWHPKLIREGVPHWPVNFVHDEWQTETRKIMEEALYVANTQADSIRQVGEDLKLNCPMTGSILNGHGKPAIGLTWLETH